MSLPDLIGYDLTRDDENQGAGLYDHPWDQPARRSIFRNVALPGATRPADPRGTGGRATTSTGRAAHSSRSPAVEPSSNTSSARQSPGAA